MNNFEDPIHAEIFYAVNLIEDFKIRIPSKSQILQLGNCIENMKKYIEWAEKEIQKLKEMEVQITKDKYGIIEQAARVFLRFADENKHLTFDQALKQFKDELQGMFK